MRLTKFNPEAGLYEYVKKAKTLDEYRAQRKAAIQRLGEFEESAECRVQKAEWIAHRFPARQGRVKGAVKNYTCSACGNNNYNKKTKFCPNCGAKMKGECDEQI